MNCYNTIGLILNIIGVIILFKWGYPQPSFENGSFLGLEDNTPLSNGLTVKQEREKSELQKIEYKSKAKCGLIFILVGFIFQLVAEIVK